MPCVSFLPSLTTRTKILLAFVTVVCLAAVTAAARNWRAATATKAAATPPATAPDSGGRPDIPVVRVTVRPTGFDPAEVVLPRGRFLLAIDNRSGLSDLAFRLGSEAGAPVREARMPREQLAWRSVLDPPPGLYVLTEAGHPEWACRVRVAE